MNDVGRPGAPHRLIESVLVEGVIAELALELPCQLVVKLFVSKAGVKAFSLGSSVELRRVLLLRAVRLKLLVSGLSRAKRFLLDAKAVFRLGTDLRI